MPIQQSFNIQHGVVVTSSPNTYTCEVREDSAIGSSKDTITCNILQSVYSSKEDSIGFFLPEAETKVLFISTVSGHGTILGYLPETSAERLPPSSLDPIANQDVANYKGNLDSDILPGDLITRIGSSSVLLTDSSYSAKSGTAEIVLDNQYGNSCIRSSANTVKHDNSLFSFMVSDPGGSSSPRMDMDFFLGNKSNRGSYKTSYKESSTPTMSITSSVDKPLELKMPKSSISIDSMGRLVLEGKSVTIKSDGKVQSWGEGEEETLHRVLSTDIHLESTRNVSIKADYGTLDLHGNQAKLKGDSGVSIDGAKVSIISNDTRENALPGIDQTLLLNAARGGIEIKSGLKIPNDSSITKPGIALESEAGGDIHIKTNPNVGSGFSTGSIVLDASLPLSVSGSGGVGSYGIVLNSPNVILGGYAGVPDTPKGVISPFAPPVPPIVDGPLKHFSQMTIHYPALLAAGNKGLTAAFPITSFISVPIFTGIMATALALMAAPTIGRPTSVHLGGI